MPHDSGSLSVGGRITRLEEEMEWISRYRQVWDARFEALDRVIEQLKSGDKPDVRTKRK